MESNRDSWEVVLPKKAGKASEPLTKTKKKAFIEKMPTIDPLVPVEESKTIYNTFIEVEERKERKEREKLQATLNSHATNTGGGGGGAKKGGGPVKKPGDKTEKKKEKPITLEEAVEKIDARELEEWLVKIQLKFPDAPEVWLKDLASLLNLRLDKVPDLDPIRITKPLDYPASLLSGGVRDLLTAVLRDESATTLDAFLDYCIESMLANQSRAVPTFGYRLFVQLILAGRPEAVIGHANKYLDLLQQNINRPIRALMILWAVGQAGQGSLANGLKVWLGVMLPVMNIRSLSDYCVLYIERLLGLHTNLKAGHDGLSKKDFFKLFDELFALQSSLSTDLRKRLHTIYPKLRVVAWGPQSESTLHNLFSSFLSRCTPDCHAAKKAELLDCLGQCLAVDKQSFSIWRQIYLKHLPQSSVLLLHISTQVDKLGLNRKLLLETVRAFHLTNEELAVTSTSQSSHYRTCVSSCQTLLIRLSAPSLLWRRVLFGVLFLILLAVAIDCYLSGGLYQSRSYRTLDELGVIAFLLHACQRIQVHLTKAARWLADNVPYYYRRVSELLSPYALLIWEKCGHLAVAICDTLQPVWARAKTQIPLALLWLEEQLPPLLEVISRYVGAAVSLVAGAVLWVMHQAWHLGTVVWNWLVLHILVGSFSPENILRVVSAMLLSLQAHCCDLYNWMKSLVA